MPDDQDVLPCDGKLAFDTKKQATTEATSSSWRYGTKLKIYKCQDCELWHMSST